jgi:hypothetical protein
MIRGSGRRPKHRSERSFQRHDEQRREGKLVLIACEGKKTEPGYFREIAKRWGIRRSQVTILDQVGGTDPLSVVKAAEGEAERKKGNPEGIEYEEIWCVFDREGEHFKPATFDKALKHARNKGYECAVSVPCFEFWYLLHFRRTARGFSDKNEIVRVLRKSLPEHDDPQEAVKKLEPRTNDAIENAQWIRADNARGGRDRPSTDVDRLVVSLMEMKKR